MGLRVSDPGNQRYKESLFRHRPTHCPFFLPMASTLSTPRFALAGRLAPRAGRARVAVVRASMDRERSGGEGERDRERSADQTARSDMAPGGMSPGREWLMKQPGIGPIPGTYRRSLRLSSQR